MEDHSDDKKSINDDTFDIPILDDALNDSKPFDSKGIDKITKIFNNISPFESEEENEEFRKYIVLSLGKMLFDGNENTFIDDIKGKSEKKYENTGEYEKYIKMCSECECEKYIGAPKIMCPSCLSRGIIKDVELVSVQSKCSKDRAYKTLEKCNWDIVNAIMNITSE